MNLHRVALRVLLGLGALFLLGSRIDCDTRTPTLECTPQFITLEQGECQLIENPCAEEWVIQDSFRLCDAPEGITVSTIRVRGVVTREICAAPSTALVENWRASFLYTNIEDFGESSFEVTVRARLGVRASANPQAIPLGQGSFLDANVTGGTPPFEYSWSPASSLDDATIWNPTAFPATTTTYTVTVTDNTGLVATDSVTVQVTSGLVVSASPSTLQLGQTSQLSATLPGGVPPFFYSWTPDNGTLSDPSVASPQAVPATTTTYEVTVIDGVGSLHTASVKVRVDPRVTVIATPSVLVTGDSSQLAARVRGGLPPYTYAWTEFPPGNTLDDPKVADPVATPSETTIYQLTVTDAEGVTATDGVTVTTNEGALSACFTLSPLQPVAGQFFAIDMSCSTGTIQTFRVWLDFVSPGDPPSFESVFPVYTTLAEVPTRFDARIEVEDADGNVAFVDVPIIVESP